MSREGISKWRHCFNRLEYAKKKIEAQQDIELERTRKGRYVPSRLGTRRPPQEMMVPAPFPLIYKFHYTQVPGDKTNSGTGKP